jgi:KipI family sensor histidine kinase inhibitor
MAHLTGLYARFGEGIDPAANARVHAAGRSFLHAPPPGVTDVVPSYSSLYIEYDPARVTRQMLLERLEQHLDEQATTEGRMVTVPVRYDGADLPDVARVTGLSIEDVIRRHAARHYRVYALGFTPGFPFMGEVDPLIRRPRHRVPRARVEAHTVAMAGPQTGIYPLASPGGWHLLGSALKAMYDPHRPKPFLLEPGDKVQFAPADGPSPPDVRPLELLPAEPPHPLLRVMEPGLLDLMVDEGRFFAGRFGLARSGPADATSAALANRLLRNPVGAPLIELNVTGPVLEVMGSAVLAFAGWGVTPHVNGDVIPPFMTFAVKPGDTIRFKPCRYGVRGYLAVAGGFACGTFLGSSSTDVRGLIGRPLRPGDVLGVRAHAAARAGFGFRPHRQFGKVTTLRLLKGPQASTEALAVLTQDMFKVRTADRMGLQLEGAEVPGGDVLSEATPLGAVQITASGRPLVLLNDRGTLGGYMKPAIVHPADLHLAAQLRPGDTVRFVHAPGASADIDYVTL